MLQRLLQPLFALAIILAMNSNASAQGKKSIKVYGKELSASRGSEGSKMRGGIPSTDSVEAKPAQTCYLTIENRTGYYLKVFVDGNYRGTISLWGDMDINIPTPYAQVYVISAGGTRDWTFSGNDLCGARYVLYP